jgi:hypothetical protein
MGRTAAAILLLGGAAGAVGLATQGSQDPARNLGRGSLRAVPGEYVVIFGGGMAGDTGENESPERLRRIRLATSESDSAEAAAVAAGGRIQFRYRTVLIGFSAVLPPAALKAVLRATNGKANIEPNWEAQRAAAQSPAPSQGLDRIGQRLLRLNDRFTRPSSGTRRVHVYVIDTGFRDTHSEFLKNTPQSRVGIGKDFVGGSNGPGCQHHGTHVAGIIGGKTFGIASNVTLHPLRVLDCNIDVTSTRVIAAAEWVGNHYKANNKPPAVANMSLEFLTVGLPASKFTAMDQAINNTISLGVTFVVAAGNNNRKACDISPARIPRAITVASTDPENDERAPTSNFGSCVDLFAPGMGITSATANSDYSSDVDYGTSSAAPHVTGVAALFLSRPTAAQSSVWPAIFAAANVYSPNKQWCGVSKRGDYSPNVLLHWGAGSTDGNTDGEPAPYPPLTCG